MRGLALYLLAGMFTVLALDVVAPPVGIGLAIGAWPSAGPDSAVQYVDRSHKGDRLDINSGGISVVGKRDSGGNSRLGLEPRPRPAGVPIGCEPAFSPLSLAARTDNFARGCVS
jgi:hypothetical protein